MIWNGTDPLKPDHEVAYRGWPTERVRMFLNVLGPPWSVSTAWTEDLSELRHHLRDGRSELGERFDLIPLQQEPPK